MFVHITSLGSQERNLGELLEGKGPTLKTNSRRAVTARQNDKRDVTQKPQVV